MADLRRFTVFAQFLAERFDARRVFDVAGGMGKLNEALTARGRQVFTFDRRHRRLDVPYVERTFTLDEPCDAELVVGLHPDGATRVIIEYAPLAPGHDGTGGAQQLEFDTSGFVQMELQGLDAREVE